MSEDAAKYYAQYLANSALAREMDTHFPVHRGWSCVIRFYAALHLLNAYLIDKPNVDFDPESTEHKERAHALRRCPELRDVPEKYRNLKSLSEDVRYNATYEYSDQDVAKAIAWLAKIIAVVEPKLKKA